MRPPIPNLSISRRAKAGLWTAGVLIVLIIALVQSTGVYVNWLWFGSVDHRGVYTTMFWTRVVLFFVFGVVMALILCGNVVIAYLMRPPFRPMSPEQQNIERYRMMLEPRRLLILVALGLVSLFAAGMSAQGNWSEWQLFLHGGSFGVTDPQFHLDVSFYAWDYPVYRLLVGFGFAAVIFAFLLSVGMHYLTGAIRLQTPGPKITVSARRHLTVLVFVFLVLKAVAYWLDRYGFVFSDRSTFTGASYTDVHSALPARTIMFWIALVLAVGVLASIWLRSTLLPGIGFVAMLILSILIGGIYPALVQNFSVKPNASSKEAPYIKRNITATREAYGITTNNETHAGTVTYNSEYPALDNPSLTAITPTNPTVSDIRILDPNVIAPAFTQQQQIKNVYGFGAKLDVDRYTNPATDTLEDYVVGVRELDATNLSGEQTNWINEHTVYTHGYGLVAAQANVDVTNGSPYSAYDIPEKGQLADDNTLDRPEVYFGELLPDYSIVGAKGSPQEYNGTGGSKITYGGSGGVSLNSLFTRLAFAVNYKQTNFVLNDAASADGAKIIFNRDPRTVVQKVAPFLKVDGDPYPVLDTDSGHIVWLVDGYTTLDNFPYSQRNSLSTLTNDSLAQTGKTAQQPDDTINYVRNSVKATVDAYTGEVKLYAWDDTDPVLKAWSGVFPGLIQPKSELPQTILEHVRYPEDLFEIQRSLLGTYHVDDPVTFYNTSDKWTVPRDPNPNSTTKASQPGYYVLASEPGQGVTAASFQLTSPMIVNGKQNLAAFISVSNDPDNYGKFTVLKVPTSRVTNGPEQIAAILNSNATISKDLSLFSSGGSSVTFGNLLTLPIGDSFLYVEPLYVTANTSGARPTLQRVLAVYGDKVGYGGNGGGTDALANALANLNDDAVGRGLDTGGNVTTPGDNNSGSPTTSPTSSPSSGTSSSTGGSTGNGAATLQQLQDAETALQDAYATQDQAKIGAAQQALNDLVQKYLDQNSPASSGGSSTTPPAPTSSP